jgi:hypothetical protein
MRIRSPGPGDRPDSDGQPPADEGPGGSDGRRPGLQALSYRVPIAAVVGRAALAMVLAVAGLIVTEPLARGIGLLAAAAAAAFVARDLALRVRLRADRAGVDVVRGLRRHHLAWSAIERVRVDNRPQRGIRTAVLELDAGEELYLLGRGDLGADPYAVLDQVALICPQSTLVERPAEPVDCWDDDSESGAG